MTMALSEHACYTLINVPTDSDMPSEIQMKESFEKGFYNCNLNFRKFISF